MELINSRLIIATSLLVFLMILVVAPCLSAGRMHVKNMESPSEIYEIDYRGPETHTYFPPPNRAGDRPRIHHQTTMARRKSRAQRNGKKIHG